MQPWLLPLLHRCCRASGQPTFYQDLARTDAVIGVALETVELGQNQGGQDGQNGDDEQEFDEREAGNSNAFHVAYSSKCEAEGGVALVLRVLAPR